MFKIGLIIAIIGILTLVVANRIRVARWRKQLKVGDRLMYHHEGEWKIGSVIWIDQFHVEVAERVPLQHRNELMPVDAPDLL